MSVKFYRRIIFISFLLLTFHIFASPNNKIQNSILHIEHWTTSNGVNVYFVSRKDLPMLDIAIAFDAGSSRDANLPGLANLTANMMNEGTQSLTSSQIADQLDQLGALYATNTDQDMTVLSLRTLTKPSILAKAIPLFTQLISQPSFPLEAFNREQKNMMSAINAEQEDPQTVALQALFKNLYTHYPYANPVSGDITTVTKIKVSDIKRFYQNFYVANNAIMAIVGNLDIAQAKKISESISKTLPKGKTALSLSSPQATTSKKIFINYPITQSSIAMGQLGIRRDDPSYFPLMLGNYLLGGGATSELFHNVRELRGLSYQVASFFIPLKNPGPFVIILQTRTEKTKQATTATVEIMKHFINQGPSEKELKNAKKFINGNFPLRIDSNNEILNYLILIGFYRLPLDYLDTYRAKMNAVTVDQIRTAFQKLIDPNALVTITVGKKSM